MNELERDVLELMEKYTLKEILTILSFWMDETDKKAKS